MKRILVALSLFVAVFTMSAQSYRGFIDLFGGIGVGSDESIVRGDMSFTDIKPSFGFGLSTSHGCQITPWGYVGIGVGAYTSLNHASENSYQGSYDYNDPDRVEIYGVYIPVSLDLRWDLNIRKKVTPFVDLKIGYQFVARLNEGSYGIAEVSSSSSYENMYLHAEPIAGFYFQPTVGIRFRMGKKSGFNLGVTYNPTIKKRIYASVQNDTNGMVSEIGKKEMTVGALMLNLGFDF